MSTVTTWQTASSSSEDTFDLGKKLGAKCRAGEVFLLVSDLGGGKTTFTKGLAKGLGSSDQVGSPSFTIERVYKCRDSLSLHHFDFYRLTEPGLLKQELREVLSEPDTVIAVEWGGIVSREMPKDRIEVNIERSPTRENERKISFNYPNKYSYLFEGIA